MIEAPNFDYKYDLALWKSFSARLSLAILVIAASVFLAAMLLYLYFSEESVREETAVKAQTQLHDAVMTMRLRAAEAAGRGDTLPTSAYVDMLRNVQPYKHSYVLMTGKGGRFVYVGDSVLLTCPPAEAAKIAAAMRSPKGGMLEVFSGANLSLLIHEPVGNTEFAAAVVCSRIDILSGYKSLIFYGGVAFVAGLLILFTCCAIVIYRMVRPLHLFAESARSIADGNLETPLPEIHSKDELLQLRNSFEYMQTSLKQYIEDLKETTATKEHMQSELTIAHDIQMGMIPKTFPRRADIDIFASMTPAKAVGGDLYDYILEGDELFFIIGDVSGKGVPASLYMAVTRTLFRNLAGNYQSAANVVREINHAIASTNDSFIFVTAFVGVLDMKTHVLTYCNAAHNPPVLIPAAGACRLLEVRPNVPIGVIDRYDYEEQQVEFPLGTALLLYTDGLTEAKDGEQKLYGEERLLEAVTQSRTEPAHEFIETMQCRVEQFAGGAEQSDDLALLFLRHSGAGQERVSRRRLLLKNELAEVERLHGFVSSVCRELGMTDSLTNSLNLAMEEAVVNVISYAYPKGKRGHVEVVARKEDDKIVLTIKDSGAPFDPTRAEQPDTTLPLEARAIGGLGIHLVRTIMDTMHYERTPDGHNLLTLTKAISP